MSSGFADDSRAPRGAISISVATPVAASDAPGPAVHGLVRLSMIAGRDCSRLVRDDCDRRRIARSASHRRPAHLRFVTHDC